MLFRGGRSDRRPSPLHPSNDPRQATLHQPKTIRIIQFRGHGRPRHNWAFAPIFHAKIHLTVRRSSLAVRSIPIIRNHDPLDRDACIVLGRPTQRIPAEPRPPSRDLGGRPLRCGPRSMRQLGPVGQLHCEHGRRGRGEQVAVGPLARLCYPAALSLAEKDGQGHEPSSAGPGKGDGDVPKGVDCDFGCGLGAMFWSADLFVQSLFPAFFDFV